MNNNETKNIWQRMHAISAKVKTISKNLNVADKYKAVDHADVIREIKPLEIEHGVYSYVSHNEIMCTDILESLSTYYTKRGEEKEKTVRNLMLRVKTTVRFVNIDNSNEFIEVSGFGDGIDSNDKAPGKAMTYARKYAYLMAYNCITGDELDAEPSNDAPLKKNPKNDAKKEVDDWLDERKQKAIDANNPVRTIADIQLENQNIMFQLGYTEERAEEWLKKMYKIDVKFLDMNRDQQIILNEKLKKELEKVK